MSPNTPLMSPEPPPTTTLLSLALLAPRDEPPLNLYLAAVDTLVKWQRESAAQPAPATDAATLISQLQSFSRNYLQAYRQYALDATATKTVDGALITIVEQYLALPTVPVHGGFGPDRLELTGYPSASFAVAGPEQVVVGPVGFDIASLTRDPRLLWDEAFTLDVAIRYWDQARKAGLPVGADFGEFYRGLEWTALVRHLIALGTRTHASTTAAPEDGPALMALVLTTCNRYIELKPLLRLLERIEGLDVQGGFVFGRM